MENNNSVCYINKINNIVPIEGADKIELATVNGWNSIVQKDIHKVGDLVLCLTTDAVIPQELCEKFGIISYLRKGNRVRTVKLKGIYSECILIPWEHRDLKVKTYEEGEDLMLELGIFKYEEPEKIIYLSNGKSRKQKDNPNFNKYYKFPNIKNVPRIFTEEDDVVITRKIHGTNARYGIIKKRKLSVLDRIKKFFGNKYIEFEYVYGSHNVEKGSDTNGFYSIDVWDNTAKDYFIKELLWNIAKNIYIDNNALESGIIIYGEIFGPGIQGEKYTYGHKTHKFVAFDIELNGNYINRDLFNKLNPLPSVPVLYEGKWSKEIQDSFTFNQFIENTKVPHEGIVISHISGDRHKIAKVINPDYHTFAEKHLVPDGH